MPVKGQAKNIGMLIPTLLQGDVEGWRNTGWAGVTSTTEELLRYWFEEERDGATFILASDRRSKPSSTVTKFSVSKTPTNSIKSSHLDIPV